jgi:hypothetical protein
VHTYTNTHTAAQEWEEDGADYGGGGDAAQRARSTLGRNRMDADAEVG